MKALVCIRCVDIRAIDARRSRGEGDWDRCRCGLVAARWIDPARGTVEVDDPTRETARILGIHNGFLALTVAQPPLTPEQWRAEVQALVDDAEGYVFHASKRNCPVALMRVGESNDTFWYRPPQRLVLEGEAAERAAEILRRRGRLDEEQTP